LGYTDKPSCPSEVEYRPANLVSQPLIVQDKFPNCIWKLFALPMALEPTSALTMRGTHSFDRVGGSTQLVCGDMRHHSSLTGSICGVPSGSIQGSCRRHGTTTRRTGLHHLDFTSSPGSDVLNRLAGTRVYGLYHFKERQNMLCTLGSPQCQKPMVGICEHPPAPDGDEARVADFGKDHGCTFPVVSDCIIF
jgi:hypothetical protein